MCGCNKNKGVRGVTNRSALGPRNLVSAQGARTTSTPRQEIQAQSVPTSGLTGDRRAIERKRREAILRKLGRL